MGDKERTVFLWRGGVLLIVLLCAWPFVLVLLVDPLIDLDALLESDMRWPVIVCVICLPVFAPLMILLFLANR